MVSDIKALSDLFIRLFSEREGRHTKLLANTITPMFETTMAIVTAYRIVILKARMAASTVDREKLDPYINELREMRVSYLAQRQSVSAVADVARQRWSGDDLMTFAVELYRMFFGGNVAPFIHRSAGAEALGLLDDYKAGHIDIKEFGHALRICEYELEHNWDSLSSAYANLTIKKN